MERSTSWLEVAPTSKAFATKSFGVAGRVRANMFYGQVEPTANEDIPRTSQATGGKAR
jgi:hypothetical protein